jgi:hypothetical protein
MSDRPWLFTSETSKIARAKVKTNGTFDRAKWNREYQAQIRQRRRTTGVCLRCGFNLVEKFANCAACRRKAALKYQQRPAMTPTQRARTA